VVRQLLWSGSMKKPTKPLKLELQRTLIRVLAPGELDAVAGGKKSDPCYLEYELKNILIAG
jgi:hypothetical protein